jgi:hypothetical protein
VSEKVGEFLELGQGLLIVGIDLGWKVLPLSVPSKVNWGELQVRLPWHMRGEKGVCEELAQADVDFWTKQKHQIYQLLRAT